MADAFTLMQAVEAKYGTFAEGTDEAGLVNEDEEMPRQFGLKSVFFSGR